jgi:hypothetical protein
MGFYQDLVDEEIQARNDARQAERGSDKGEWHPSSLTGCQRAAVYDYTGTERTDEPEIRNIRIMDRGTSIHEEVQAMVVRSCIRRGLSPHEAFLVEVKVDHAGIKGSCDGLLKTGTKWEVQEYKSISPTGKKFMHPKPFGKRGPGNEPEPKPEHVKQARIYQRCLKGQGFDVTDTIRIVYFDRDDYSVWEFEVEAWLDVEWYEFLGEIADLEDHVQADTLPYRMPMTEKKGRLERNWQCGYCPFATRCWNVDKETTRG